MKQLLKFFSRFLIGGAFILFALVVAKGGMFQVGYQIAVLVLAACALGYGIYLVIKEQECYAEIVFEDGESKWIGPFKSEEALKEWHEGWEGDVGVKKVICVRS